MTNRLPSLAALAVLGLLGAAGPALAGPEVNTSAGLVVANGKPAPGLAVHGYDVVAYFTQGMPVRGDARFASVQGEATYRFATKANLDTFAANPQKYVPAYGGFCAYGVSVNAKFDGNPENWKIVDGKLYLNVDSSIQEVWLKDVPGNINKAEAIWPAIKDKAAADIK